MRHRRHRSQLLRRFTLRHLRSSTRMLLMPNPGDVILIPNCPCCGSSSSSVSSTSSAGASSSSNHCSCCCSLFVSGVEVACDNCIYGRTSRGPGDPCYNRCITDARLIPTLTLEHGGTTESLTSHPTQCTEWYNYTSLPPFQSSAILRNNEFTFFYVRSTSPLCIYTATGVPCVNGQTFTWNVSPPGAGCPATLTGTISW